MKKWIIAGKLLINILAAVLIFLVGTVWSFIVALDNAAQEFYFYMGMMFTALIIASVSFVIWGIMRKKAVFIPTCCMLLLCLLDIMDCFLDNPIILRDYKFPDVL